ncbi:MAG TPA: oligopeptide:H+ symporter, partial [Chitinophagaceae bacterium]|nr:oligopeptide:H+ symporter [Chitinophagaceae bacterium]
MATQSDVNNFFGSTVIGHPSGLFVLFFTEMWERFSYYGMRAILVLFLTTSLLEGGWGWPSEEALALYGTYTSLVYVTPIIGGWIADKHIGYRAAVVIGAVIMTLGHASLAVETNWSLYLGLFLLVAGNGFFKPNMTSIISQMYEKKPEKQDGAFTIFYMGVNAGAFLGILLCGYVGEMISWSWGFGLAGIFMFFGMLQFYFAQGIFGSVGKNPKKAKQQELAAAEDKVGDVFSEKEEDDEAHLTKEERKRNPFTKLDIVLTAISAIIGIVWVINDPISKIGGVNLFNFHILDMAGSTVAILFALLLFFIMLISRLARYRGILRDKMIAVAIFAFFTVFFWAAFEQAGG